MKTFLIIFCALYSSLAFSLKPSDFDWKIKEEKDGIKIYSAPKHESGIIPIKAETIIEDSMPRILSVIADTPRKPEWVPNLMKTHIVELKSKYSRVEYSLYDSPWPFDDRAFVISTNGKYNKKENSVFIDIRSIEHNKVPMNPDHVRGKTYIGSVYMKGLEKNKTFFQITLLTDFKGSIPSWIINLVQRKWPYKMFRNIKRQLKKDDIQTWDDFKSYDP